MNGARMRTVGIVGGIGPESTVVYYRTIIALYRARHAGPTYPRIVINSIEASEMLGHISEGRLDDLTTLLAGAIDVLARSGADFALVAANTPHIVFEALRGRSALPLISIVEATSRYASQARLKRVGLLGTRFTMESSFYQDVLGRAGISVVCPGRADRDYVHEKYMTELFNGSVLPATREGLLRVVDRMRETDAIDGLVLGGTELSLIFGDLRGLGIPVLDTAKIHAAEAVAAIS
jgi:aspartate racemase